MNIINVKWKKFYHYNKKMVINSMKSFYYVNTSIKILYLYNKVVCCQNFASCYINTEHL